jgi:hypothetical protein
MRFKEEIRIYSERHMELLNKFCRKNAQFVSIKSGSSCSNQCALEGHKPLAERATLLCTFKPRMLHQHSDQNWPSSVENCKHENFIFSMFSR